MASLSSVLDGLRNIADKTVVVTGGAQIAGEVTIQGGKNTANKLVAAAIAVPNVYRFTNFPIILDPLELLEIAEYLGAVVDVDEASNSVLLDTRPVTNKIIPYEMTRSTTSAFGFAGALLGRFGSVDIGKPGGDQIGARPIDLHIACLEKLGATASQTDTTLTADMDLTPRDHGSYEMALPSTGAAVNAILAAVASHGALMLTNCPRDTDLVNMCHLLEAAGIEAQIDDTTIRVDARQAPSASEISFACAPDRNDSFTWLAFGAMSTVGLTVHGIDPLDLAPGIAALRGLGVDIQESGSSLVVRRPAEGLAALPAPVIAALAPRLHSDWAPLLEVVMSTAAGQSVVVDLLFSDRTRQIEILQVMGADASYRGGTPPVDADPLFKVDPNEAKYIMTVSGPSHLTAVDIAVGNDVRACASAVLAAAIATGTSHLQDMRALHRGYQKIQQRLAGAGITISYTD